jgi:site-specific DNA-methyltransferase (adenine-specific)
MEVPALAANQLYKGDCIARMREVEQGSVDLVFADPPFNIGYDYDVYEDSKPDEHYLDWSRQWIKTVSGVLKPTGTFWLAIGDEYAAELKLIAQNDAGFTCRSWVIWYYTFGVNCTRKFTRSHAHLFHFVKDSKEFTFNYDDPAIRVPSARQLVYADRRANPRGRLPDDTWILRPQDVPGGFSADQDTWYFSRVAGTFKERAGFHGCQMPEQLLGRIIRASSNDGDLVLDPFAGSGTTLAVAKKLGRRWMGFELSSDYVEKVASRLATIEAGQPLDGPEDPVTSAPQTANGRRLEHKLAKMTRKDSSQQAFEFGAVDSGAGPAEDTVTTRPKGARRRNGKVTD